MKKTVPLLFISTICLLGCSNYKEDNSETGFLNHGSKELPYVAPYLTTTKSPYRGLICGFENTWESYVFLVGWRESKDNSFNLVTLTADQKKEIIKKGIEILSSDASIKTSPYLNSTILANYYSYKQDHKQAMFWAFKGAESGSASCMHILGKAYMSGTQGLVQDFEEGLKWVYLGSALGDKACEKWIKEGVSSYLFKDKSFKGMVLEAQKKSSSWMKEHSEFFATSENHYEKKL